MGFVLLKVDSFVIWKSRSCYQLSCATSGSKQAHHVHPDGLSEEPNEDYQNSELQDFSSILPGICNIHETLAYIADQEFKFIL